MTYEITIKNFDSCQILKIIINTTEIEVILKHVKELINGHEVLKIKKIIPIVVIEDVVVQ